jgi:hypothetical protein
MLLSNHGKGGFEGMIWDTQEREGTKDSATVAAGAMPRSIPIYQFNHPSDLLLATLPEEVDDVRRKGKYTLAGIVGYGFAEPQSGTVQLWRHFESGRGHHFYSLDRMEKQGILDEGMAVWVYPKASRGTVPVLDVLADGSAFYVYPKGRP